MYGYVHSAAKVSAKKSLHKQTCMRRKRIHEVREVSAKLAQSHCDAVCQDVRF